MGKFHTDKFEESGLTMRELSETLKVSVPTVWRWVRGKSDPQGDVLAQLIEMGLATSDLPIERVSPWRKDFQDQVARLTAERDAALAEVRRLLDLLGRTIDLADFPRGRAIDGAAVGSEERP